MSALTRCGRGSAMNEWIMFTLVVAVIVGLMFGLAALLDEQEGGW